jgi:hypothetical protein
MISAQNDPKFTSLISRKNAKGGKKARSQLKKFKTGAQNSKKKLNDQK